MASRRDLKRDISYVIGDIFTGSGPIGTILCEGS